MIDNQMLDLETVESLLKTKVVGLLPESDSIMLSAALGGKIETGTDGDKAMTILAKNLDRNECKIFDCKRRYRGLVGRIRKRMR